MDPEQTAPRSSLIWVHTVCHVGFLNISADKKKQTTFVAIGALRVKTRRMHSTKTTCISSYPWKVMIRPPDNEKLGV